MILKIQRDKQKRQESGSLNPSGDPSAVSSFDKLISINRSENGGKDGNYHLDGEQSALMSLLPNGNPQDPQLQGTLSSQVAAFFSSGSGNPGQEGQAGFIPHNGSGPGSSAMSEGTGGSGHGNFSPGGPTDSSHSNYNPNGSSGGENSASGGGLGSSGFMNGSQASEGTGSQGGPGHYYPPIEYGKTKQPTQVKTKSEIERGLLGGDDDSIILKGTSQALEQSVVARASKKQEAISVASRISCIAFQSPKFSGYLLAAFGNDRQIDSEFMALVRKRLTAYMIAGGHQFSADDSMSLELKEVAFESWAIEKAEFLRKSLHHGHEVALAFFPKQVEEVKLEISAHEDMLSMSLDEVDAGRAVGFDVYIYLPTNDKYVRYTGRGGVLYEEQKDRLKSKGSEKIHLRKDSVQDLHRYRVQRFLNDQIAAFQKRRNEPPVSESSGF